MPRNVSRQVDEPTTDFGIPLLQADGHVKTRASVVPTTGRQPAFVKYQNPYIEVSR
jgi:hypothetical protein